MKISNQKYSLALVSIALILLSVLLVSFAKADPIVNISHPSISKPQIRPPNPITHASFTVSTPKYNYGGYHISGELIEFTDTSTSFYRIVSWNWDFGDGHSSNLKNPTHTYDITSFSSVTKVPVTLKVKNQMGYTSTATKEISFYCIN